MIGEKEADVYVHRVEFGTHLRWRMHHPSALVCGRELRLVAPIGHARRETGHVDVGLGRVADVPERDPPGHVAVRLERPRRLVYVDVEVNDQEFVEILAAGFSHAVAAAAATCEAPYAVSDYRPGHCPGSARRPPAPSARRPHCCRRRTARRCRGWPTRVAARGTSPAGRDRKLVDQLHLEIRVLLGRAVVMSGVVVGAGAVAPAEALARVQQRPHRRRQRLAGRAARDLTDVIDARRRTPAAMVPG